jgi:DNA-binding LacI/PurR family transcriptional regulator
VVTIRDIAKATGLSIATVSMVLNKAGRRIPASTQKLVEQAARDLGYSPNLQARSLRSRRTNSIGVLVFDITDPYCTLIIRGIENTLYDFGYMPVLTDLQNNPERLEQCAQMLMERRVEGLIAIANPVHLGTDLSAAIHQFGVPAVVIGSEVGDALFASVVVDNGAGTAAATQYLLDEGHREIAVIKGPRAMVDSKPRFEGVRETTLKNGIKIRAELVVEIKGKNSSYEEGYQLTEQLLRTGRPFTALVAFDDLTAFAAIGALSSAGIKVPEGCSVIGFDDIPGAAYYNPPLTTVNQHLEIQGNIGAQVIQRLVASDPMTEAEMRRQVAPHLIVRKTTAAVPAARTQSQKSVRSTQRRSS